MKNFKLLSVVLLFVGLSFAAKTAAQTAGMLDPTFGTGGKVATHIYNTATLYDLAVQSDGKIVVVGTLLNNGPQTGFVARFNVNGTLDTSFNGTGVNGGFMLQANAVKIQPDGKIVVAGHNLSNNIVVFSVARFNPNGTYDTTLNAGAYTTTFGIDSTARAVAVQADGKIVAAGMAAINTFSNRVFALVRYNVDGTLDATFGSNGRVATDIDASTDAIADIALQADGKIVAAGYTTDSLSGITTGVIARYNTDGTLDATFGTNGKVIRPFGASNSGAGAVTIQADGKILITTGDSIVRYNTNGTLDRTFDSAGINISSIAIQADGKIVAGGSVISDPATQSSIFAVARYNADGTLDMLFGIGGKVTTAFNASTGIAALALTPDGKIVAGGTELNNNFEIVLARYLGHGVGTDFDGDGKADVSVFRPSTGTWFTSTNPAANYGAIQFGAAGDKIVPADYDGDGKTDVAVFRSGTWYIQRSTLGFVGVTFGDGNDIPVPADYDGDGKADIAVFRPSTGVWYLLQSTAGFTGITFGQNGDKPVTADYDGDGKADIAVNRNGTWYIQRSQAGFFGITFGDANDKLVPADYDGDGKADVAVFRPSTGVWYLQRSTAGFVGITFGASGDLPVPADYDGDGKADVAVFRDGTWYLNRSTAGFTGVSFGATTDAPVPNAFVR